MTASRGLLPLDDGLHRPALLKQKEAPVPRMEDYSINEAFRIPDKDLNRQA